MPEIVAHYCEHQDILALGDIYESLLTGYRDDVEKYASGASQTALIRHILTAGWWEAGGRITFEKFGHSAYRSKDMSNAFKILGKTMLLELVYPTVSTKLPIIPSFGFSPKLFWLDTGIVNYAGKAQEALLKSTDISDVWSGRIAEHIIGQELIGNNSRFSASRAFWTGGSKSTAEVDFVIQYNDMELPIEVKSGNNSKLKSLHVFMDKAPHDIAVRFWHNPERTDIVKRYTGKLPIFDNFGITKQIKSSFGRTVSYKSGAYLIIEHTEALHVVDVNSGNRSKSANGQEANALDVNLGAADELARQLRLRDMGGIIVVDFIDMNLAENRQKLYERMCQNMQKDRAKHNILPLSKFGLMQITRQRVRPAIDVATDEDCPTCFGKGKIKPSILFTDSLENKIDYLVNKLGMKKFTLHIHPYVAAYVNQGIVSLKRKWQMKYGFGIKVIPNQNLAFLQYKFFDSHGQELDMKEESEIK